MQCNKASEINDIEKVKILLTKQCLYSIESCKWCEFGIGGIKGFPEKCSITGYHFKRS
jgi:hypothetical protein